MFALQPYGVIQALEEYPIASLYLQNYQKAITHIQRCSEENPQFMELKQVSVYHNFLHYGLVGNAT